MPFKLVVKNARMSARAFCDGCGERITDASLAHCAYPDVDQPLREREGETYEFAILHKGSCTDRWEKRHGHMRFMEFQTFLVRLGDDSLVNWAWAFETEGTLKNL